ncbi:MAG: hypothetical protein ACRCSN_09370, partial [Dermatophilaceae bacterium]
MSHRRPVARSPGRPAAPSRSASSPFPPLAPSTSPSTWSTGGYTVGTTQDRVREYVTQHAPTVFRIADVRAALPGVSEATIRLALERLEQEGRARPQGTGRA